MEMTTLKTIFLAINFALMPLVSARLVKKELDPFKRITVCEIPRGCVFKTVFEDQYSFSEVRVQRQKETEASIDGGVEWLVTAQNDNGGWGAGSHYQQNVLDPKAVNTDPATTAMSAMALLRTGSSLSAGPYTKQLKKATMYLIEAVENTPEERMTITPETNTQIQVKLGGNIDAILTLQYLSNIVDEVNDKNLEERIRKSMDVCTAKIERNQGNDGSMNGAGWAGVLQSSLATNALEAAQAKGAEVDEETLERSRDYQKSNYDVNSGNVRTEMGAGIVLYSVSGTARATAKDARKVKEEIAKAEREGRIRKGTDVNAAVLQEIGFGAKEAEVYAASYQAFASTKSLAQDDNVVTGFGNNGGEEFLSYLQTGESLIIGKDESWNDWYKAVSDKMVAIQNADGSWNGHHCITSPVFCTATALLILSIDNDIQRLQAIGNQ